MENKKIITAFFDEKTAEGLDQQAAKHLRSRSSELVYIVQQYLAELARLEKQEKQSPR